MKYPDSVDGAKLYLTYIYNCLSQLTYYNRNAFATEETIIEDFNFKGLIEKKWRINLLTDKSLDLLIDFRSTWIKYKESVNYANDPFFYFYDKRWSDIVEQHLIPALDSMASDFDSDGIDYVNYKELYIQNPRPTDEEILERGQTLYGLLLKHGIMTKSYME